MTAKRNLILDGIQAKLAAKQKEIQERIKAKKQNEFIEQAQEVNESNQSRSDIDSTGLIKAKSINIKQNSENVNKVTNISDSVGLKEKSGLALADLLKSKLQSSSLGKRSIEEAETRNTLTLVSPPDLRKSNNNPYFDPKLYGKRPRNFSHRKQFSFIEKGKLVARALKLQKKHRNLPDDDDTLAFNYVTFDSLNMDIPSNLEWWDIYSVINSIKKDADVTNLQYSKIFDYDNLTYDTFNREDSGNMDLDTQYDLCLDMHYITDFVQHPAPLDSNIVSDVKVAPIPVMLTSKEKKKLRRQKRFEMQRERQEKVRLGLLPPEQTKVKVSNMMHVYGDEFIIEPSKIEEIAREQEKSRAEAHKQLVASTKLSNEQRGEKYRRKIQEDASLAEGSINVAVFKIIDLSHPQLQFKITKNASQYELSGVCLLSFDSCGFCLVIVEGGPKSIKKYKKLILNRIQWSESLPEPIGLNSESYEEYTRIQDKLSKENKTNSSFLVWEGIVPNRMFNNFRIKQIDNIEDIRKYLDIRGAINYLDMANSSSTNELLMSSGQYIHDENNSMILF